MAPNERKNESPANPRGAAETLSTKPGTSTLEPRTPTLAVPEVSVRSVAEVLEAAIRSGALPLDRVAAILRDTAVDGSSGDPEGKIREFNASYVALKAALRNPSPGWQYPGRSTP